MGWKTREKPWLVTYQQNSSAKVYSEEFRTERRAREFFNKLKTIPETSYASLQAWTHANNHAVMATYGKLI